MKKIAIALTTLSLLTAPALADTIHTDGPTNPSKSQAQSVSITTTYGSTAGPGTSRSPGASPCCCCCCCRRHFRSW